MYFKFLLSFFGIFNLVFAVLEIGKSYQLIWRHTLTHEISKQYRNLHSSQDQILPIDSLGKYACFSHTKTAPQLYRHETVHSIRLELHSLA
jgi:hypothetical protein